MIQALRDINLVLLHYNSVRFDIWMFDVLLTRARGSSDFSKKRGEFCLHHDQ